MKLQIVNVPATKNPIRDSPGFEKKGLSTHALDILGLCEYGCRYCSSNNGNYLRIRREPLADATEQQLGARLYPSTTPELTFHWPDVLDNLRAVLDGRTRRWGAGKMLVFSMLTDGFSPSLVASGTTRAALDLVLERTDFRIRVLTKNACVGLSKDWLDYFGKYAERFVVGLSTGTLDDLWSKRVEINTSPPSQRLKALRRLQDAGVPTYGMLCPIFPDMLEDDGLERLIDAIDPSRCETVWAEPYNDRTNWLHVQAGYEPGSRGATRLASLFGAGTSSAWSNYATDLLLRLRMHASTHRWTGKLVYLLYEHLIAAEDAQRLHHLGGVSLQSVPRDDGRSRNTAIAAIPRDWLPSATEP